MRATLTFTLAAMLICSVRAEQPGRVGIFINDTPDFRIVAMVVPDSPAARAGVQVGDRMLAIDDWSTSEVHSAQELATCASGAADTEVEVELERSGVVFRVRMWRVAVPETNSSPSSMPDVSGLSGEQRREWSNKSMEVTASSPAC